MQFHTKAPAGNRHVVLTVLLVTLILEACNSTEGGSGIPGEAFCQTIGGGAAQASEICNTNCNQENIEAAVDGSFGTYATVGVSAQSQGTLRGTAQDGVIFPEGRSAGVYLNKPPLASGTFQITVNTYLDGVLKDSENTFAESGSGGGLNYCNNQCIENGSELFIGIPASEPFDAIEIVYSQSGGMQSREIRVYEFCTRDN